MGQIEASASVADRQGTPSAEPGIEELKQIRSGRRSREKIARLHHHAIRTDDMERTRAFYEDILEMPMVSALKETVDPTTGATDPYLHCFFEMKDGMSTAVGFQASVAE